MNNEIKFFSSFIPSLKAGRYTVTAWQTLKEKEEILTSGEYYAPEDKTQTPSPPKIQISFPAKTLEFYVDGPKFELEPGMVHQVYPVEGVRGNFVADVPSLVLNRITLPWERKRLNQVSAEDSWLMLFMVNEAEAKEIEEGKGMAKEVFGTGIDERYGQSNVNYLKIPKNLKTLFPKAEEYKFLSYCRAIVGEEEKAVILGNRLPTPNNKNTVYLLSLEHVKEEAETETYAYLHKWDFYCLDTKNYLIPSGSKRGATPFPDAVTDRLFSNKDDFKAALQQSGLSMPDPEIKNYEQDSGTFHGRLHGLKGKFSSFNYPVPGANDFIKQGALALKEAGAYQWYRGPLQAAPVQLLLDAENNQKWTGVKKYFSKEERRKYVAPNDRTYQVAFELGALTALKDEAFHRPYFEWKQQVCTALLMAENAHSGQPVNHLQVNQKISADKPLPPVVKQKIDDWKKLNGIPYSFLIPSVKMLPAESIRTFYIDRNWVNAFLLGAFSIGNTYDRVEKDYFKILDKDQLFLKDNCFGFLIHSLAVSGWPDYITTFTMWSGAYKHLLNCSTRKNLAKNIELFICNIGNLNESHYLLTFQLPPGKMHSGFRFDNGVFKKQYKLPGDANDTIAAVTFYNTENETPAPPVPEKRVLNIAGLAGSKTPAEFGMMLLEHSSPVVIFSWSSSS